MQVVAAMPFPVTPELRAALARSLDAADRIGAISWPASRRQHFGDHVAGPLRAYALSAADEPTAERLRWLFELPLCIADEITPDAESVRRRAAQLRAALDGRARYDDGHRWLEGDRAGCHSH